MPKIFSFYGGKKKADEPVGRNSDEIDCLEGFRKVVSMRSPVAFLFVLGICVVRRRERKLVTFSRRKKKKMEMK